jgi:hypothetical protein
MGSSPGQAPPAPPEAASAEASESYTTRWEELWQTTMDKNRMAEPVVAPDLPAPPARPSAGPAGPGVAVPRRRFPRRGAVVEPAAPVNLESVQLAPSPAAPVKAEPERVLTTTWVSLSPPRRRRRVARYILISVAVLALAVLGMVIYSYSRAYSISRDIRRSVALVENARSAVSRGEVPTRQSLDSLVASTSDVQRKVGDAGFVFEMVGYIPFLGRPVNAVRLAAEAADDGAQAAEITRDVMVELFGANPSGGAEVAPVYRDGRIDVRLVADIGPKLSGLLLHLEAADSAIRRIRTVPFANFANDLRARALAQTERMIQLTRHAVAGAQLVPPFFGQDRPKTYLLVLQDAAAFEGTDGNVIAYGTLTLSDGVPSLSDVNDGRAGPLAGSIAVAPNASTSFEAQARAWGAAFREATGHRVDGVIGLDPSAVAALLDGRPPIQLLPDAGSITSQNVVSVLEKDFFELPLRQQYRLARGILAESIGVLSQPTDVVRMLQGISDEAVGFHVELWAVSARQQELIRSIGWGGRG